MLSPEAKQARIGKITSSVAAACLGLSSRMSPLAAWLSIRGEADDIDSPATQRGDALEAVTLDEPCRRYGWIREPAPFVQLVDWAGDSCDAIYTLDGVPVALGEGKTAGLGVAADYGEEGTDEIPDAALIQALWHLIHHPTFNVCVVPVLVGGYDFSFKVYNVLRNEELQAHLWDEIQE